METRNYNYQVAVLELSRFEDKVRIWKEHEEVEEVTEVDELAGTFNARVAKELNESHFEFMRQDGIIVAPIGEESKKLKETLVKMRTNGPIVGDKVFHEIAGIPVEDEIAEILNGCVVFGRQYIAINKLDISTKFSTKELGWTFRE
ncbi:MAG: hypothetical protein WC806_01960 [Candidatus Gracilibacteria bacterium]|jgi:hypothetical protein